MINRISPIFIRYSIFNAPQTLVNGGALIAEVIKNVDFATKSRRINSTFELDNPVRQCCHIDFYLSQVNNGGHYQFIRNTNTDFTRLYVDIKNCLFEIGAKYQLFIFNNIIDWYDNNWNYFDCPVQREIDLDFFRRLDEEFDNVEKKSPIDILIANWIRSWPDLEIVADTDFNQIMIERFRISDFKD